MWPQTLQMSEDDCRSTLRRIELETYSNVIGCFRAQGGLNEKKARLLEELRGIFHISQDRHRAEARRVANDEHLSTIAKVVSGPNTWQEWSREGRRSYPMLPRMAPHTALGWIANNLASEAAIENSKLLFPAETAAAAMEEQATILAANAASEAAAIGYSEKYIVKSDPFKVPDIPAAGVKKNLKRTMNEAQYLSGSSISKKRNTNDLQGLNKAHKHLGALAPISGAILLPNNRKAVNVAKLQQQRFFYQQQQKAKKLAKAANKRNEKLAGAVKSGRKSKKLKEQLNQQIIQQEEHLLQHEFSKMSYENQMMQQLGHLDSSTNNAGILDDTGPYQEHNHYRQHHQQQQQQHIECANSDDKDSSQTSFYLPLVPQIAASKRDITRNLTKLQIPGQGTLAGQRLSAHPEVSSSTQNQLIPSTTALTGSKAMVDGKIAPLSTPVQKYIVEDRQPPLPGGHNSPNITSSSSIASTQQTSANQFMSLPPNKLRALNATTLLPAGTKLSSASSKKLGGPNILSATLQSPGTPPENIGNNASHTTSQIFSLVDGGGASVGNTNLPSNSQAAPSAPTHAPPAVIQLHSNEFLRAGSQPTQPVTSAQSKVLTTKILPIVLSSNNCNTSFSKADPSKNSNSTIVSTSNFITNSGSSGTTIIKSLAPSMFVSGQQQHQQQQQQQSALAGSSPIFSSFGSAGSVYRKPPNILKSSSSSMSRNSPSSGAPQILSNIRLTPAITTGSTTNSNFTVHQTQSGTFQQQLRTGSIGSSTTGIRTSVKICQSSNGKVFIQPANVDTSKLTKLPSGHISQRILPGTLLGNSANLSASSGSASSNQPGSPHRIAIQKVQIIPAPLPGSALGNVTQALQQQSQHQQQQQQQRLLSTSLAIGAGGGGGGGNSSSNKANFSGNIFMQTCSSSGALRTTKGSNALTLTKSGFLASQNELPSGNNIHNLTTRSLSEMVGKPSNVVVIDATTTAGNKIISQNTKLSTMQLASSSATSSSSSSNNISRSSLNSNQMITEDTPVDIIVDNSPHMVADADSDTVTETTSITAVLASNVHENAQTQAPHSKQKRNTPSTKMMLPVTVLNVTDWEMELDQATAASLTHNQQNNSSLTGIGDAAIGRYNKKIQQQPTHVEQLDDETKRANTIIIDDGFDDVIIEEEEEDEIDENEQYIDQEEGREEDMDIEASHDAEIIMVENRSCFDEGKSNDESEDDISDTTSIQRTIMLNNNSFKNLSSMNDTRTETPSDELDAVDVSHVSDDKSNKYECISEVVDGEHEAESNHTGGTTEMGDINCNNHEESAKFENPQYFANEEDTLKVLSTNMSTTNISTMPTQKTTVSASLYSLKGSTGSINKNELGEQETSLSIDISKENQSSSSDQ